MLLALPTGDHRGIDLRKNLIERKRHFHLVHIRLTREDIRSQRAQFAKSYLHHTAAELREDLIQ